MSDEGHGSNCSDEVKQDAYRKALRLKIAEESAHETYKSKQGAFRAFLKASDKLGVDTKAIANMLKVRFEDPDLILIEERERLKMYELSGFLPGIMGKLESRYSVIEPTVAEEEESQVLIAYDHGHLAGRKGHLRDNNPYQPGTLGHAKWVEGYLAGQRAIADEMVDGEPAQPTEKRGRGRPKGSGKKAPNGGGFTPDTAESVAETMAEDDGEPVPSVLH